MCPPGCGGLLWLDASCLVKVFHLLDSVSLCLVSLTLALRMQIGYESVWFPKEGSGEQGAEASPGLLALSPVFTLQLEATVCHRKETDLGQPLP